MMQHGSRLIAVVALTGAAACGGGRSDTPSTSQTNTVPPAATVQTPVSTPNTVMDTVTPRHHSKLAGAALGAAAGHALGGHAVIGAAAGALIQHERNKHATSRP